MFSLVGCSAIPGGYSKAQWAQMSPREQEKEWKTYWAASRAMHDDLARDAATENGFHGPGRYGPW
jgi:hypothetical protein